MVNSLSNFNADGSLRDKTIVTTSADGLSVTTQWDSTGDGSIDRSSTSVTTLNANGSTSRVVSNLNADGSTHDGVTTLTSANGMSVITSVDTDGDGTIDQTTLKTRQTDGSLSTSRMDGLVQSASGRQYGADGGRYDTISANGQSVTTQFDADGDGLAESQIVSSLVLNSDGSTARTTTRSALSGGNASSANPVYTVSNTEIALVTTTTDGLSTTSQWDMDGSGTFDQSRTDVSVLNADGSSVQTSSTFTGVTLDRRIETTSSADSMSTTTRLDATGSGTYSETSSDVVVKNANGATVQTIINTQTGGALISKSVTTTSADGRNITIQSDAEGTGSFTQSKDIETVTLADGSRIVSSKTFDATSVLVDMITTDTSADGRVVTINTDANGDGNINRRKTITQNADGTSKTVSTDFAPDGTKTNELISITSADKRTKSSTQDTNGDGVVDQTTTHTWEFNADGSSKQVTEIHKVSETNNSVSTSITPVLERTAKTLVSADGKTTIFSVDVDGDGVFDEISTTIRRIDGTTEITTISNAAARGFAGATGAVLWSSQIDPAHSTTAASRVVTLSADGLSRIVQADYDDNGTFEHIETWVTHIDGSQSATIKDVDAGGASVAIGTKTISADGLTITLAKDTMNYGIFDHNEVSVTSADGSKVTTVTDYYANGPLKQTEVTSVDAVGNVISHNISGNSEILIFNGGNGNNILTGSTGSDYLDGGSGNDHLYGGSGDDILVGGAGNDKVYGQAGDDILYVGEGNDIYDGGSGNDTISYLNATAKVNINLTYSEQYDYYSPNIWANFNTILNIENITGSSFDDNLRGNAGDNILNGAAGNDRLDGGAGNDTLNGGAGNDRLDVRGDGDNALNGGEGNDSLNVIFGDGDNALNGGAGNDYLNVTYGDGDNALNGGAGNDYLNVTYGDGDNALNGGEGNDSLNVIFGDGDNALNGGAGNDYLNVTYGDGDNALNGGAGNDYLNVTFGDGDNALNGGAGNDYLNVTFGDGDNALNGGAGNDYLNVTFGDGDNALNGGAGNDYLNVTFGDGDNALNGGEGNDSLNVIIGDGDNALNGGAGNDYLNVTFGDGDNALNGGEGNDSLNVIFGDGDNALNGGEGNDSLGVRGDGDNVLNGGEGNDSLNVIFGDGDNALNGGGGDDTLYAGVGVDHLEGGDGNDTLHGGDNDDILIGGAGDDILNGGGQNKGDRADYSQSTGGVNINLATGIGLDGTGGTDTLISIERVTGSNFDDILTGSAADDSFSGNLGDDVINGAGGDDLVWYSGAVAAVNIDLDSGVVTGGEGNDTLISIEYISGSTFADTIYGSASNNWFNLDGSDGLGGADYLDGRGGTDEVSYWNAIASVNVDLLNQTATDSRGHTDTLIDIEDVSGGAFNDTITGDSGANMLSGGSGNDTLNGGTDNDVLNGEAGNDILDGGADNDQLHGGAGDDKLYGGLGDDQLYVDSLDTWVDGGAGFDIAHLSGGVFNFATQNVTGIEQVNGSALGDIVDASSASGTDANVAIYGNDGDDILTGASGNNLIEGGDGADILNGGGGADYLNGGLGDDILNGGDGNDTLQGGAGNDTYTLSGGEDSILFGFGDGQDDYNAASSVASSDTDIVALDSGIAEESVWFTHSGNDLVMQLLGSTDSIRFKDWYNGASHRQINSVEAGGRFVDAANIESLVSAMASFSPNDGATPGGITSTTLPSAVQVAVSAAWEAS